MFRRVLPGAAIALASIAAFGQLFSVAHLLLVPHRVCAEHGELVHLDAGPTAIRHAEQDTASSYRSTGSADSGDTRDHCFVSAIRKETLVVRGAPGSLLPLRMSYGVVASGHEIALPPAVAILQLAPKNSPPARLA